MDTTSGAEEDVGTEDEDGRVGQAGLGGAGEGSSSGVSGGGGDFHLIAHFLLGQRGRISCWLSRREAVDVALTDMGLRFGSRIRLLKAFATLATAAAAVNPRELEP